MVQSGLPITYQWVSQDNISRYATAVTLVHEDDELGIRFGAFDWEAFWARAQSCAADKSDPSGSTIPQQLVKNLYLWPAHDWLRKGIEAGLSQERALFVPKKRIMELYLNYAQFGPKLYGICAASWDYYNRPPSQLGEYQAAQLVGMLADPERVQRAPHLAAGPDIGANADLYAVDLINGAANVWVPRQLDTAADHRDTEIERDGCSSPPVSVTARIKAESGE